MGGAVEGGGVKLLGEATTVTTLSWGPGGMLPVTWGCLRVFLLLMGPCPVSQTTAPVNPGHCGYWSQTWQVELAQDGGWLVQGQGRRLGALRQGLWPAQEHPLGHTLTWAVVPQPLAGCHLILLALLPVFASPGFCHSAPFAGSISAAQCHVQSQGVGPGSLVWHVSLSAS